MTVQRTVGKLEGNLKGMCSVNMYQALPFFLSSFKNITFLLSLTYFSLPELHLQFLIIPWQKSSLGEGIETHSKLGYHTLHSSNAPGSPPFENLSLKILAEKKVV